jgi:hypothetical protein
MPAADRPADAGPMRSDFFPAIGSLTALRGLNVVSLYRAQVTPGRLARAAASGRCSDWELDCCDSAPDPRRAPTFLRVLCGLPPASHRFRFGASNWAAAARHAWRARHGVARICEVLRMITHNILGAVLRHPVEQAKQDSRPS